MGIECYYNPLSSPSRAVLLTAKNLGIPMNLKLVDIFAGEQNSPEFTKMNPLKHIPVLDDNGFYLYESRAVMQYLANAYGHDDSLYPKDAKKRFVVDQRLMFDQGELYQSFVDSYFPAAFHGQSLDGTKLKKLDEALGHTNKYLEKTKYFAGDSLTIADFTLVATLSTIEACGKAIRTTYPFIKTYMDTCNREIKGYTELNQQGADQLGQFVKQALQKESKKL